MNVMKEVDNDDTYYFQKSFYCRISPGRSLNEGMCSPQHGLGRHFHTRKEINFSFEAPEERILSILQKCRHNAAVRRRNPNEEMNVFSTHDTTSCC